MTKFLILLGALFSSQIFANDFAGDYEEVYPLAIEREEVIGSWRALKPSRTGTNFKKFYAFEITENSTVIISYICQWKSKHMEVKTPELRVDVTTTHISFMDATPEVVETDEGYVCDTEPMPPYRVAYAMRGANKLRFNPNGVKSDFKRR